MVRLKILRLINTEQLFNEYVHQKKIEIFALKREIVSLKNKVNMTNSELWDVIMEIYQSKHSKDTSLVISSIDDHFNCYFEHLGGQLHFRITVENSFFSDRTYIINNIYHITSNDDVSNVSESKLKEHLIPIIREAKLNLIGI